MIIAATTLAAIFFAVRTTQAALHGDHLRAALRGTWALALVAVTLVLITRSEGS